MLQQGIPLVSPWHAEQQRSGDWPSQRPAIQPLPPDNQVALNGTNGLWVRGASTLFILDTGNGRVRRLDTNGVMRTLFAVTGGNVVGRGLWLSDDETLAYVTSLTVVKRWSATNGVIDFATGFIQPGNLVVDATGNVVVADRGGHRVYRLDGEGRRTVIAGNGAGHRLQIRHQHRRGPQDL
jgi:sugar lactone lactonase YvrE